MDKQTIPLTTTQPEEWLAWLAEQPCYSAAAEACVAAGGHWRIMAYAVGKFIAENRQDELAERIAREFLRLREVLAR